MLNVVDSRISEYKVPKSNGEGIEDIIFSILVASSRERINNLTDVASIQKAISWAVSRNVPVNISLLWALSAHARSSFKIFDWECNVPRLGDIWALYWFYYLNQKVKIIYPPGINIVLVDEVPLSRLMGWSEVDMDIRRNILRLIGPKESSVNIVGMPDFTPSQSEVFVLPAEIFSVLTSSEIINVDIQIDITDDLYCSQNKSWETIKEKVGIAKWNDAEEVATQMSRIKLARKETDWVRSSVFSGDPYIDGSFLKKGRWCPDIWDAAMPQHGGSLLTYDGERNFSVKVVPEFRLDKDMRMPCRVLVDEFQEFASDLLPWKGGIMLYWT